MFSIIFDFYNSIHRHKALFLQLIRRNMALRYQGSFLGVFWGVIQPLIMLVVYTFVFGVIYNAQWPGLESQGIGTFAVMMFCGMAVYNVFSEAITMSAMVVVSNPNYVKKVIFPLGLLPLAQVISSFIWGGLWILLLLIGALVFLGGPYWTMLLMPITVFPAFLLALGLAYFASSLCVYIRDIAHAISVVLQILFFATPIFYSLEAVSQPYRTILCINPLTLVVEQTRWVFLLGKLPHWPSVLCAYAAGFTVLILGMMCFMRIKRGFADVL